MGVKKLVLLGSYRVEKSYFGSPFLEASAIRAELVLGLEQGRDTILPDVSLRQFFKPFVEDELDVAFPERARLPRAPGGERASRDARARGRAGLRRDRTRGRLDAVRSDALRGRGFTPVLARRVLRVDAAACTRSARWSCGSARGRSLPLSGSPSVARPCP